MYEIEIDKSQALVSVKLRGMLSVEDVSSYISELRRQFIANHLRSYRMLLDVRECPIQGQDMIRAMGEHMATMPKASAIAVVAGSSLARMQVRRLFKQSYARMTSTMEEGRAWALSGIEPATF